MSKIEATEKRCRVDIWKEEYASERDAPKLEAILAAAERFGEDEIIPLDLTKPKGEFAIFRTPTSAEHSRFTATILGEKGDAKARAAEVLARNTVVFPDKVTFGRWCDEYPAIGGAVIKHVMRLAGGEVIERGKE